MNQIDKQLHTALHVDPPIYHNREQLVNLSASIARTAEHLASDLESDAGANHPDVARDARGFARAARDLHRLLGERQSEQVQERALGVTLEWWDRLNGRLQELRAPRFEHTQQVATQLEPEIARLQQSLRR